MGRKRVGPKAGKDKVGKGKWGIGRRMGKHTQIFTQIDFTRLGLKNLLFVP